MKRLKQVKGSPQKKMLLAITQKCMYELCPNFTWLDKIMRRPHWVYKTLFIWKLILADRNLLFLHNNHYPGTLLQGFLVGLADLLWSLDDRLVKLKTQVVRGGKAENAFPHLSLPSAPLSCTDLHSARPARASGVTVISIWLIIDPCRRSPLLQSFHMPRRMDTLLISRPRVFRLVLRGFLYFPPTLTAWGGLRGARRTFQRSGSIKCTHRAAWLDFTRPVRVPSQLTGHEDW